MTSTTVHHDPHGHDLPPGTPGGAPERRPDSQEGVAPGRRSAPYGCFAPVTPEEAVSHVQSGQRIFVHGACAVPTVLIQALVEQKDRLKDVEIVHIHTNGPAPYCQPGMQRHFRHNSLFMGANVRNAVNEGLADYTPVFLSDIPHLFRNGQLPIDVAFLHLSPPDGHGFCSFGTSVDCAKAAAETARIVVAQINPRMPRTHGDSFIHVSRLTSFVEVDQPIPESPPRPLSEEHIQIGKHVASLVEDGATLQMGIGTIPDAVLLALMEKKDLGIHTEMFSDRVVDLVEAGVITGARKSLHPGKIISSFLMGTKKLYNFVHDNPMVEMHPIEYVNDTSVIRRNDRMVAVNSAIEIDLTGQVCADSIGFSIYSGVGGQMDFMRGAALAPGGKPIIALPSTVGGKVSRIVPVLLEGAGVTTTRSHVHYVVTEWGVAYLHGKTIRQRAQALIQIAHPKFRDALTEFAREKHYL